MSAFDDRNIRDRLKYIVNDVVSIPMPLLLLVLLLWQYC
jgi:hypothetical protein